MPIQFQKTQKTFDFLYWLYPPYDAKIRKGGDVHMFFSKNNLAVRLSGIYTENFTPAKMPVFLQVSGRKLHTMSLSVRNDSASMTVDGLEESLAKFFFSKPCHGYFSLVSNSLVPIQGGYRYIKIVSRGKTLLEIDFTNLESIDELERYFDCYYFDTLLPDSLPQKAKISDYWKLNDLGHLICQQRKFNIYHQMDASNMCMLTLKDIPLEDFDLTLDFVQSWGRYGVTFGCPKGAFPYYYNADEHTYITTNGAFAYVEAEGHRTMRGDLIQSAFVKQQKHIVRYSKTPISTFHASDEGILCSSRKARLLYHIDSEGSYVCSNTTIPICSGQLTYLPPFTNYKPPKMVDKHIAIEFDILYGDCCEPDFIVPKRSEKIRALFEKLLLLQASNEHDAPYRRYSIFYQILTEAQNNIAQNNSVPRLIQPSLDYMHKNFADSKLTIAEIAEVSNISEVYFRQIFKKSTGQLPNKYILDLRINHASFLLQSTKYKVTEIALKSGFSDIKYFTTVFKKVTGFSPHKYRQLHN